MGTGGESPTYTDGTTHTNAPPVAATAAGNTAQPLQGWGHRHTRLNVLLQGGWSGRGWI